MLLKTEYIVPKNLLDDASGSIPVNIDFRHTINQPTGNFFYDPWVIKPEYKNTIWEKILDTLPLSIGEARIIVLNPQMSYHKHADIDDRYHLNIQTECSYLIDLENLIMHQLTTDGVWYLMDAGRLHTASNYGRTKRIQLVVRKLLYKHELKDPVKIRLSSTGLSKEHARYIFDSTLSPWLNRANKIGKITEFEFNTNEVKCSIDREYITQLKELLIKEFYLEELE